MFHSRRLASVGLGRKTSFNILQSLIVILFSAYLFSKAITTDCHQDDSRPFCSRNFPNYSLLTTNGSGPPTKSKLNIFSIRPKFSPKSPNSKSLFSLILILSGNIETNPGPKPTCPKNPGPPKPTWPCGTCQKDCPEESDASSVMAVGLGFISNAYQCKRTFMYTMEITAILGTASPADSLT